MLNAGENELSHYEQGEIISFLQSHTATKGKQLVQFSRYLILHNSLWLRPLGKIQRIIVDRQQKRRAMRR